MSLITLRQIAKPATAWLAIFGRGSKTAHRVPGSRQGQQLNWTCGRVQCPYSCWYVLSLVRFETRYASTTSLKGLVAPNRVTVTRHAHVAQHLFGGTPVRHQSDDTALPTAYGLLVQWIRLAGQRMGLVGLCSTLGADDVLDISQR